MQRWVCTAAGACWAVWITTAKRSHGCVSPLKQTFCERRWSGLRQRRRPLYLTMEAGALTRWASAIVPPVVERLIICEPRHNRLINSNPTKSDEADVEGMCLLLRLGKLKEVWMGQDRTREIYRALVYELLNWRDAQRELKALLKARYRGWGVLKLNGLKVFSKTLRQEYLAQLPGEQERRMMGRIYSQH